MSNRAFLDSVASRIAEAILDFCTQRTGREFHADDLRRHVTTTVGACAPGSADRVLRDLRQKGAVDYQCVSRAASLYRVQSVNPVFDLV